MTMNNINYYNEIFDTQLDKIWKCDVKIVYTFNAVTLCK